VRYKIAIFKHLASSRVANGVTVRCCKQKIAWPRHVGDS